MLGTGSWGLERVAGSVAGSVPPIYTKGDTLYYYRRVPLAKESGSEGSRRVAAGLRGTSPALAGKLRRGWSFRAVREGKVRSLPMLAPDRSRCASSRGRSHLFTQKGTLITIIEGLLLPTSWGVSEGSRRVVAGLRGPGPVLAGKLGERMELSRCARGEGWIASNARSGPNPLRLVAGSVSPIYTKGDTLYYSRRAPLAKELRSK